MWALNPMIGVLKRGRRERFNIKRYAEEGHVTTEAETEVMHL